MNFEILPMDADSYEEVLHYYKQRQKQLLFENVYFRSFKDLGFGVHSDVEYDGKMYLSVYIYKSYRGKGHYKKYVSDLNIPILTTISCNTISYLENNKIEYIILGKHTETDAYKMISKFYGSGKAKRSDVYFMNHIDEGLYILKNIGASQLAMNAYCLHPIVQSDEALVNNYKNSNLHKVDTSAWILAMEYRRVANAYLSKREIKDINEIELSPLKEVNDMLIADKIQNRKDFELYHIETHPRSKELQQYFKNWLERLGISEEQYQEYKRVLE